MKLQYKLYLFFTGVVLLPLLVATVSTSVVLSRSSTETYENRIRSGLAAAPVLIYGEAHMLAGSLEEALKQADATQLANGDNNARLAALNSLMEKSRATNAVLTDSKGMVLASAGKPLGDSPPLISAVSAISIAGVGQWQISVYRPFNADTLGDVFLSEGLEWALLDKGTVILGSLPAGRHLSFSLDDESIGLPPADNDGKFYTASSDDLNLLASTRQLSHAITSRDTVLLTGVREDSIVSASRDVLRIGLTLMLIVIVMAAVLGYLMARNITRPLRELSEAAKAGIKGNLDRLVKVRSNDEVGNLAKSFNDMRLSIRKNISEIEESRSQLLLALSYTSDILGSTMDRSRLIKTTAEAARLATGARGIQVELFASSEPAEHEAISVGVPRDFFKGHRHKSCLRMSADLAKGLTRAGDIRALNQDLDMQAYPIAKDNVILGTLVAVYDHKKPMEESRRRILNSLTSHAASALENVSIGDLQHKLAVTDSLTGLHNLRYLINAMLKEVERSERYGHSFAMAILDLDDFKKVNDRYGHPAGDALLVTVATTLKNSVRASDIVARYGGEEFAVVLPETTKEAAVSVMEKLRQAISQIRLAEYPKVRITISIGIAGYPCDARNHTDLLSHADEALYLSKESGKNRITLV